MKTSVPPGVFITGTDTEVGKTWAALAIMAASQDAGLTVAGMKPVACGAEVTKMGPRNQDALLLQSQSSMELPYELVNPYCFEPPIAPNIAAQLSGVVINLDTIQEAYFALGQKSDLVVVEGVGGWYAPISATDTVATLARRLSLPVVLVVGMRLGCLSHALLSYASIRASGLVCCGWIATPIEASMARYQENIISLRERIGAPYLGELPRLTDLDPWLLAKGLNLPWV